MSRAEFNCCELFAAILWRQHSLRIRIHRKYEPGFTVSNVSQIVYFNCRLFFLCIWKFCSRLSAISRKADRLLFYLVLLYISTYLYIHYGIKTIKQFQKPRGTTCLLISYFYFVVCPWKLQLIVWEAVHVLTDTHSLSLINVHPPSLFQTTISINYPLLWSSPPHTSNLCICWRVSSHLLFHRILTFLLELRHLSPLKLSGLNILNWNSGCAA